MKKKMLLFTLSAGIAFISLSSADDGPALAGDGNLTGSKNTIHTCGGGGCHGGTSANTSVTIEVDSAGVAVTRYKPGTIYNITIKGHNTASLPKFGYQYAVVSGTGVSQVQAGTNSTPANSHITVLNGIKLVEHSQPITGSSGNYSVPAFTWTAPAAGTGVVTMYCTLNAVDGDGIQNAADLSNNVSVTLTEAPTGLAELSADISIKTFPNPATSQFSVKMDNADIGTYNVNVYDMSGRVIATQYIHATGANTVAVINCTNWPRGYYGVQVSKDGAQRVLPVIKL